MLEKNLTGIAPHGRLRAAINLGNKALAQDNAGSLDGVSPALAKRLAEKLELPIEYIPFTGAGKVFEDAGSDIWDVAFLAIDKIRAKRVSFTRPYVIIESTYAVRAASPYFGIQDADRPGMELLVARGSAYDLHLSEVVEHAQLTRADSPGDSMQRFRAGEADMVAGVRQSLETEFVSDPNFRILSGRFKSIEQAMVLPIHKDDHLRALDEFVAAAISDGFVRRALNESGQSHLKIA